MNYSLIFAAALFAVPAAASEGHDRCALHDINGSWVYYSVANGSAPYTTTCSLQISSGAITSGTCVQSGGQSLTATGSLSIATANTNTKSRHLQKPLKSVDHGACTITGTITYSGINVTEMLTNLTITHFRDEIVGVGTNGTGLLSATFVRSY